MVGVTGKGQRRQGHLVAFRPSCQSVRERHCKYAAGCGGVAHLITGLGIQSVSQSITHSATVTHTHKILMPPRSGGHKALI